jgi:hypothetical protein
MGTSVSPCWAGARGTPPWLPSSSGSSSGTVGVLYTMPNFEGLTRQIDSMTCAVTVAAALNRELVAGAYTRPHFSST